MFDIFFEFITGFQIGIEHIDAEAVGDDDYDYLIVINLVFGRILMFHNR